MATTARTRIATRFAAAAGAALMVFTGAAATTLATATPAHAQTYYDSMVKAMNNPSSNHCWKHAKKYDDHVYCTLGKKYQDYEVTDLTGPHYDSDTGVAAPGPALRDVKITVPSKFGKTRVTVLSQYAQDANNDGTNEFYDLTSATYTLKGGDSITVRVPVAAYDPVCGGHDIHVRMTETSTGKVAGGSIVGINTPDGVDRDNPPAIQRVA